MRASIVLAVVMAVSLAACSSEPAAEIGGSWVGTITTEGNVTTVVNQSGSVWGGTATLVEEASIGVLEGEEHYMLAEVTSIAASDDRIYVLEINPPTVRVYDFEGKHLKSFGSRGQGPGEFAQPMSVAISPDRRVFVRDDDSGRMTVFSADGELLTTWRLPGMFVSGRETVITPDGTIYTPQSMGRDPETRRSRWAMVPHDTEGTPGEPIPDVEFDYERPLLGELRRTLPDGSRMTMRLPLPFSPRPISVFSPEGATVAGVGTEYKFEVRHIDGRVVVVERGIPPVPVGADEADWQKHSRVAARSEMDPDMSWTGHDVPDHKPFFEELYPDYSGRIWVRRRGPSTRVDDCDGPGSETQGDSPRLCWMDNSIFDVFGSDGRYLGEVEFPAYLNRGGGGYRFITAYIRDDVVLFPVEDEAGTPMVKRFRLVPPS